MIRGIHHTAISTGDLKRAVAFYRDVLGFEIVMETGWPVGNPLADSLTALAGSSAEVVLMKAGNAMFELFEYASPKPKEADPNRPVNDHGLTHICLDVTDIDAEYERLVAAGMHFHCPPIDYGLVKTTYGRDPDGNVIEIQEILDPNNPMVLESVS